MLIFDGSMTDGDALDLKLDSRTIRRPARISRGLASSGTVDAEVLTEVAGGRRLRRKRQRMRAAMSESGMADESWSVCHK